ncbi:Bacterial transcriptional regulator [compost metagenome]
MPLVNSAAGRLFASYLPEHFFRPLMETEWQKHQELGLHIAPQNWQAFTELKETIRQQEMSAAKGDLLTGINAVGLPVFNSNQSIEFCIVALDSEMFLPVDPHSKTIEILKNEVKLINQYIKSR